MTKRGRPKTYVEKTVTVSARIPVSLRAAMRARAEEAQTTWTAVMVEAVAAYLEIPLVLAKKPIRVLDLHERVSRIEAFLGLNEEDLL